MRELFRSNDLQARFTRDGYVEVDLLALTDCERLTTLYDECFEKADSPVFFSVMEPSATRRKVASEGIRALLGPLIDQVLIDCHPVLGNFFCKQPARVESEVHMHQDWSFVDEVEHDSLTVWCPLENINETSGTLAVIPGSHRLNSHARGFVTRFPYPELEPVLKERYSRPVSATPGRVVMFHQRLFHWSSPNHSASRRLAANCFVAPREATVRFPHSDPAQQSDRLELFEADDALLTSFELGRRPEGAVSLGFVTSRPEPLTVEDLSRVLDPVLLPEGS